MGRRARARALAVWMNGEMVGRWTTAPGKPDEFEYAEAWLGSEEPRPLSLSMPLRPTPYKGSVVEAYFDNLLPENRRIRERVQRRFNAASTGAFDLLQEIGRDCVGAVQMLPVDHPVPDPKRIEGAALTRKQVGILLQKMLSTEALGNGEAAFRISLAGAQEKSAFLRLGGKWLAPEGATPSTHIVKLPIGMARHGIDLTTSVENEWLCAQILREFGVPVTACWMDQFGEQKALVVERFDRRMSSDRTWIVRLPQEDFCQALGIPPDRKYESEGGPGIRRIMEVLLGSSSAEADRVDFFKTQMLFWMLAAIDGHAKNFSLFLEAGGGYRLTPRYDVLSAHPVMGAKAGTLSEREVQMAMAVQGKSRHYSWKIIQPRHWEEMARRCGIAPVYPKLREELIERTPTVIEAIERQVPEGFPARVLTGIIDGLKKTSRLLSQ